MTCKSPQHPKAISFLNLWQQFIPLSLSDVTMALGDPMITTTLAHLADSRVNLAAVGIAKALAIFFESPIIMILHASNALASRQRSRRALWQFMLLAGSSLSLLLLLLTLPFVFTTLGGILLGIPEQLQPRVRLVLMLMILWPFAIAWRRYFQGILIHTGHSQAVAIASIVRLATVAGVLIIGFRLHLSGALVAALALMAGVLAEAIVVTLTAYRLGITDSSVLNPLTTQSGIEPEGQATAKLPDNLMEVWHFYWPLASSMLMIWGGRAVLVGIIARASDADIALAAWPAAWGLVLVIANATRMVQQVIIKNRERVSDRCLIAFAMSVGSCCSLLLLLGSTTPLGLRAIQGFVGGDLALIESIRPVLFVCTLAPLLVATQNAMQGFLVGTGHTKGVNHATGIGTLSLLLLAFSAIQSGITGATAAAIAMMTALVIEVCYLGFNYQRQLRHR